MLKQNVHKGSLKKITMTSLGSRIELIIKVVLRIFIQPLNDLLEARRVLLKAKMTKNEREKLGILYEYHTKVVDIV